MKKIVFISGMGGGKRDMFMMKHVLKDFDIKYFNYDTKYTETVEQSANKLKKFIGELEIKQNEKISIIGLSGGGIIADYYLKFIDDRKVDKVVTICSPFKGSWLHLIFSKKRKGLQEIQKESNLIKKLNAKKLEDTKSLNFWCWFDPLVPGTSAKGTKPKHTLFFIHWIIQFWLPLIYKTKRFLDKDNQKII